MSEYPVIRFPKPPVIHSYAGIAGEKEGAGPMGHYFDRIIPDPSFGEASWERAESRLQQEALALALQRGGLQASDLDCIAAGDLINQCTVSSYAAKGSGVPFLGVFGACSTMAESLLLSGVLAASGACRYAAAVTSSHNSTAERQFRFPLTYGGQRTPTAQWTCTAAGAAVVSAQGTAPRILGGAFGRILDLGVTDATNMGAAMAPAAADTIARYLRGTQTKPSDYDAIVTGDLGAVGTSLLFDLLGRDGFDISGVHLDCGAMMFDPDTQDTHAGGSGCGCSASILCACLLPALSEGRMRRILFAATGALLSLLSSQQGESLPGICHLAELAMPEGGAVC